MPVEEIRKTKGNLCGINHEPSGNLAVVNLSAANVLLNIFRDMSNELVRRRDV